MKKVVLISGSTIDLSPYIKSYVKLFERNTISFDLIYWNRYLAPTDKIPSNFIPYNKYADISDTKLKKVVDLFRFRRFVSKVLCNNDYSFAIVFTIAEGVFLNSILRKYFDNHYIFDIRDHSPLCKYNYIFRRLTKLIGHSSFTVISSKGFLNWLPKDPSFKYVIAHNTNKELIESQSILLTTPPVKKCKILTIGQIRDANANIKVVRELGNCSKFELIFAGFGLAVNEIKEFTEWKCYQNVIFTGKYQKEDEEGIVERCDMINIYMMHGINSDSLMSNRFYLSVLHRKPMIVTGGTFQAKMVKKYNLGVIIEIGDSIADKIEQYWKCFSSEEYEKGCLSFLQATISDINIWEDAIIDALG